MNVNSFPIERHKRALSWFHIFLCSVARVFHLSISLPFIVPKNRLEFYPFIFLILIPIRDRSLNLTCKRVDPEMRSPFDRPEINSDQSHAPPSLKVHRASLTVQHMSVGDLCQRKRTERHTHLSISTRPFGMNNVILFAQQTFPLCNCALSEITIIKVCRNRYLT